MYGLERKFFAEIVDVYEEESIAEYVNKTQHKDLGHKIVEVGYDDSFNPIIDNYIRGYINGYDSVRWGDQTIDWDHDIFWISNKQPYIVYTHISTMILNYMDDVLTAINNTYNKPDINLVELSQEDQNVLSILCHKIFGTGITTIDGRLFKKNPLEIVKFKSKKLDRRQLKSARR